MLLTNYAVALPFDDSERLRQPLRQHKYVKRQQSVDYFSNHASSPTLQWYPCYDSLNYKCARLEVPFDYSKPKQGDIFKLAIVKVPAKPDVPYLGTFWLIQDFEGNVDFTVQVAQFYQAAGLGGYDFISWDSRAAGHTTPTLQCFPDQTSFTAYAQRGGGFDLQLGGFNGSFPPTDKNIRENIKSVSDYMEELGEGCKRHFSKYLPYMGSVDNARDLNNIISQLPTGTFTNLYFYSYQTVLGATYAAMFPDNFDRMTLDGVVDAAKVYDRGDNDQVRIQDGEKAVQAFFDSCAASAPCTENQPLFTCSGCYFWAPTANGVKARYEALKGKYYNTVFKSNPPSPVCGDCSHSYFGVARDLLDATANPAGALPLAMIKSNFLLELELGHAIPGGAMEFFNTAFPPEVTLQPYQTALRCLDQDKSINGQGSFQRYLEGMNSTSSQAGAYMAARELECSNWPNSEKLKNPFKGSMKNVITKNNMLFISNTADPLTSVANAQAMSARFTKSTVLTINGLGHTTFFSGDSACLNAYRSNYLSAGTLPPAGSFCNDIPNGAFGVPYQHDYR